MLFQSLYSLLKSCKHPAGAKFVFITSEGGSMDSLWTLQSGLVGYGASKAAMNFVCRKIHAENEWLSKLTFLDKVLKVFLTSILPRSMLPHYPWNCCN